MEVAAAQHKSKQRFWRRVEAQRLGTAVEGYTPMQIARLAGDQELVGLLANAEFKDWFLNVNSNEELLAAGAESAIRCLLDIVLDDSKYPSDRIKAAKMVLDLAGVGKKSKAPAFLDEGIAKMTEQELRAYIAQQMAVS